MKKRSLVEFTQNTDRGKVGTVMNSNACKTMGKRWLDGTVANGGKAGPLTRAICALQK